MTAFPWLSVCRGKAVFMMARRENKKSPRLLYMEYQKCKNMSYYFNTVLNNTSYEQAIDLVTAALKEEGFGVLTRIDVKETLKQKIDADFRKYIILGACNPHFAHKVLQIEPKLGVLLPCNVVVEEHENGDVEVSAVDPVVMMTPIRSTELEVLAAEISEKLRRTIQSL